MASNASAKPQAAVFERAGRPLRLQEFDWPSLKAGEVLVEVLCCTLCGSDLHTFTGRRETPCPTVLGHEIVGRVCELPDDGKAKDFRGCDVKLGQRVTWSVAASCGGCFFCSRNLPQKCERLIKYGHQSLDNPHPLCGGLASHCLLAAGTTIVPLPDELENRVACPANCATSTVAAALRTAGDCRDCVVVVQGAGMLGLTAAAMARFRGAREVIVSDVDSLRLKTATRFGATRTVDVTKSKSLQGEIAHGFGHGHGADIVLEMSGQGEAFEAGLDSLRIGGRYVLVGAVSPAPPVSLSMEDVVRGMFTISGVHNYAPADLAAAIEFLAQAQHEFPFSELIGESFLLQEANGAFERAARGGSFRIAVMPKR